MTSLQINTPELQQILCAELGGDVALPSEVRIIDGSVEGIGGIHVGSNSGDGQTDRWRCHESAYF